MADISRLGGLKTMDPVAGDYQLSAGPRSFPKKGRYTFRVTDTFNEASFGESKSGALTVQIDPTIASGPHEGFKVRFTRVSNKTYKRGNDIVSQLSDFLKACGVDATLSGDAQESADRAEQTANLLFDAYVDWRLWAKGEGPGGADLVLEGMENFPKDEKGNHVPYIQSKVKTDPETGEPVILRANLVITRYVAQA
jgi:hypothetical protein